jgi:histidine ammonia-lyase
MIAQIASAALINECQVLSHPASTGTIPTSGGKEDHVSMGMTGALKLRQIVWNVEHVVAIELMCAAQGLECRLPLKPGIDVGRAYEAVRRVVTPLVEDRVLAGDMERLAGAVRDGAFAGF